jgi:hypothetical protein
MKFQNRIRMQVIVGLGAALLLAGSARAQQEMDPTYFDVNPGTPAASKVVIVKAAQESRAVNVNEQTQNAVALASSNEATLDAGVARIAVVDTGILLVLLAGIILMVLYVMAATRRERRNSRMSPGTQYTNVSAATAQ